MNPIILELIDNLYISQIALRFFKSPRILLYHGVTERSFFPGIENYRQKIIAQREFSKQIQFLQSNFRIVSLKGLVETWLHSPDKAQGMLAITFDDGYQNIFRTAFPVLRKYNVPFTIFLPTDFIERKIPLWVDRLEYAIGNSRAGEVEIKKEGNIISFPLLNQEEKTQADSFIRGYAKTISDSERQKLINKVVRQCGIDLKDYLLEEPDYKPLNWNEILQMVSSGLTSIGSHAASHAIATRLSPEDFHKEVVSSRQLIKEKTGKDCSLFAYPNGQPGDFSEETAEILKKNGFLGAVTTVMRFLGKDAKTFSLPRFTMDETDGRELFLATVSGVRMFLRTMRDSLAARRLIPAAEAEIRVDPIAHFDMVAKEYGDDYTAKTPRGYSFRIRRQKIIKLLNGLSPGTKVLDVGCGPGVYIPVLLEKKFNVWGVDPAPEMIQVARDLFKQNPHTHFVTGNIESLHFEDNFFDAAIAAGLFEYLEDIRAGFKHIHRVLPLGGVFVVTFPYRWSLPRIWDSLVISPIGKIIRKFWSKKRIIESKEFSPKRITEILKEEGFTVEKVVFYNAKLVWTPLDRLFPRIASWISKTVENFTPSFLKTGIIIKAVRVA